MKTTKKLLILSLVLVMAIVAVIPSTFSWYAHSGEDDYQGNEIKYEKSDLPLSLQQSGGLTLKTYTADRFFKKDVELSSNSDFESIGRNYTSRYITSIKNNGAKDVSVNLEMSKLTNNANVFVGTCDPVVNERSFAARATLEKVDWDYEVIYFEPRDHYSWWQGYSAPSTPYCDQNQGITYGADSISPQTDMNLEYQIGTDGYPMAMQKCLYQDHVGSNNYDVYRAFVTTEADSLFFFNHYYITQNTNLEWNRTPTVTDFSEGRVYYLNGNTNDLNNKAISYHDSFNGSNICVYYYYKTATMAAGKTANLGLSKGTSDMVVNREEFDYTGKSISYSSSDTSKATVSQDGLVTAKAATGNTPVTITTTITGEFGDTVSLPTTVNIPPTIDQVPIVQNVKIPAGKTVDISWYVRNASSGNASFKNVFVTV